MDDDRRRLIEEYWREFGQQWPADGRPTFKVPIRLPVAAWAPSAGDMSKAVVQDRLIFEREDGWLYGRRAIRVTCEGHLLLEAYV